MKGAYVVSLFLIVIGLIGVGLWLYSPDIPTTALESRFGVVAADYIEVAGCRLRLKDQGPRDAPVILMLHGLGSSLETWDAWAANLTADHRVIRFDLPGFGLTGADPTGDYSDDRAVLLIGGLMDRLGVAKATLIGHSLGGRIAWHFAAARPERVDRLILIAPDGFASPGFAYDQTPEQPWVMRLLPYVLPKALLRLNLEAAYGDKSALSEATLSRYRAMMLAPGVRRAILQRMRQVMLRDPRPILAGIHLPTLLLWGEQDGMIPLANAQDYLGALPQARLATLPGLGHVLFEEAPDRSLLPVRQFLAE